MSVSIIVPFRGDGGHRDRAWRFVLDRYARLHPGWQVVTGDANPEDPWSKGRAVNACLEEATGEILVISDADVVMRDEMLPIAVEQLQVGSWVVPHGMVYRLNEVATETLYAGGPCPDPLWSSQLDEQVRRHTPGGGIVVIPRKTYEQVPIDSRFEQWGGEDMAFGWTLEALVGAAVFLNRPMWHLYHPRAYAREGKRGSARTEELLGRYHDASGDADAIREVMAN